MERAVVAAVGIALWAPAAHGQTPLIPRDLAPLLEYEETLVQVDRGVRPPDAAPVAARRGVWSLPSRVAVDVIPRLAVSGTLREFGPDRPLVPLDHGAGGDPLLGSQWWLARVGADRVEPPGPGVPLVVIDSGLDITHPEFAGRPGTELLTSQTVTGRNEFHGTAVTSLLAAPANGVGVVGVYPRAALKVWDVSPRGFLSTSELVAGLDAAPGRSVVNLSLGSAVRDALIEDAVLSAYGRGVVVVAASGNSGLGRNALSFPGSMAHVLTVASTGRADNVSGFSTRSQAVDVAAPGEEIAVAVPPDADASGYRVDSGRSFSAPIVAGAAAWVWTVRPELDKTQLMELIRRSARDIGAPGRDEGSGFGLLDVPAALTARRPHPRPIRSSRTTTSLTSSPTSCSPARSRR